MNLNWKNIISRAAWTFLQAALGTLTVLPAFADIEGWRALGYAAVTAGVAALVSLAKTILIELQVPAGVPSVAKPEDVVVVSGPSVVTVAPEGSTVTSDGVNEAS